MLSTYNYTHTCIHQPCTRTHIKYTQILAGAVVAQGELDAVVTAIGANTFFGKTMTLLGSPEEKGHLQKVLGRVSAVLGLFALAGVYVLLLYDHCIYM